MKNSIKDLIKSKSKFLKNKTVHIAKQLLYVSFTVLMLSSCSGSDSESDNNTSDYYFKATLDGRKINFHTVNFQGGGNDDRFEHIVLGGFETPYPTTGGIAPPSLDFEIWKLGGNITTGTYATPAEEGMIARYAVQTSNGTILYNTSNADDIFTVKIEAISKNGIKGTFSGKVRNLDSGKVIEITEGSFNLPYKDIVNP
nr:hypothetical protein [uncultured Flavobacterium sp.]